MVSIPKLSTIGGGGSIYASLWIANNQQLTEVSLPSLTIIGPGYWTIVVQYNNILARISLPALTVLEAGVTETLDIESNSALTLIFLPSLAVVDGMSGCYALYIINNLALTSLFLPSLTFIGLQYVVLFSNAANLAIPGIIHQYTGICQIAAPSNASDPGVTHC